MLNHFIALMALREPTSMAECVYYTKRVLANDGKAVVWVFKEKCSKCGKALMAKPKDSKTGKAKIRASEYVCPECGFTIKKEEYEDTLTANITYTCPKCKHKGELQIPFKRKKTQIFDVEKQKKISADALVFHCEKCNEKIAITKKMK